MKTITVSVEQGHIEAGLRQDCRRCPIAIALNEQHPMPSVWRVGHSWARWRDADPFKSSLLPIKAVEFIMCFDSARPVEPFTFEMEVAE
jgi:hypothetical protein